MVACLYFQCAAKPRSAISSIRCVRICTSTHIPSGPITVECNASYPFDLGMLIQSRRRSCLGVYMSVIEEYICQHCVFSDGNGNA